jgi:hypothetical protein
MKEEIGKLIAKFLTPVVALFLPVYAIGGRFHATGNYWLDLLIAFGSSGILWLLVWLMFRKR